MTQVKAERSRGHHIGGSMPQLKAIQETHHHAFRPIGESQVDLAYPLVREIFHSVSLPAWRVYARRLIDDGKEGPWRRGISVAEGPRNNLRGLFSHHLSPHPEDGERLSIDCLVLPDALGRASVVRSLLLALDDLARENGCRVISVHLTPGNSWLESVFEAYGSESHTVVTYLRGT